MHRFLLDRNEIIRPILTDVGASCESRCCAACTRAHICTYNAETHDPYTSPGAQGGWSSGISHRKLSTSAAEQMNECGRTRDWRDKSAPRCSDPPTPLCPPSYLSFPPALFLPRATEMILGSARQTMPWSGLALK